jgi:cob(I)alamin adenosyltransferase
MDQRINRLEEKLDTKLDSIVEKLHDINITLIRNTDSLEVHEMRTDIAEKKLSLYEDRLDQLEAKDKLITSIVTKIIPGVAACVMFVYKMGWFEKLIKLFS